MPYIFLWNLCGSHVCFGLGFIIFFFGRGGIVVVWLFFLNLCVLGEFGSKGYLLKEQIYAKK